MRVIVCGCNGAGKSTLGRALGEVLRWPFLDIEDYYFPAENRQAGYAYGRPRTREEAAALLAAGLGVWLLGLTAAGVVFGAVSRTARGQGVQPVLALGVRAAGAVLAALAVSALFAWGVWVGRAQYRVTALEPLDPALLAACPALSASIGATLPPGETEVLVYGGPVPAGEGVTAQYLLVARGLSGPPAVRPQPARYRFTLTWQPGGDEMQAWLLELRGERDFALEQRIAGQQEPIGLVPVAPDSQTQTAWQTELAGLWAAVRP